MRVLVWSLLCGVCLMACGGSKPKEYPPPIVPGQCTVSATANTDISEPGPFRVGYREMKVTYQPPGESGPRTINLNIWYPTNDTTGTPVTYFNIFPDQDSWLNASLAPPLSSCGYPTIEYSHGDQGVGGGAAYLMRHFASHGWVALAPDHTGNTLIDNISPHPTSIYFERSTDMSAVLDAVAALKAPDPLAGKVATDRVLLVGHSFGTFTVWASAGATFDVDLIKSRCQPAGTCTDAELGVFAKGVRDPRVVAGIPMAGTLSRDWFGPSGETSVHIPLFQMTGGANDVGQYTSWPTLQNSPMYWIDIAGACHESFNLGGCATLPNDVGYKIVRTYAMAFARYYVLGDRSAQVTGILDGSVHVSDLVTYKMR